MNKKGFALKIVMGIVIVLIIISSLTVLLNKKDKITAQVTTQIQKNVENIEEITVGEEANKVNSDDKIKEIQKSSDAEDNLANNKTNSTIENQTFYLQMLNSNKSNNVSIKKQ